MQKILIFGFPHCGTTILKSIIGHIENVEEIIDETNVINKETEKKYILAKWPFTSYAFFTDRYNEYIKIFIIRNPLFVFSSLNKRYNYNIPENHSIEEYINTIKFFIKNIINPLPNIYLIKYEDMFNNNYQELKNIFDAIGFIYDDKIFDNTKYFNQAHQNVSLLNEKPKNYEHILYRTWQINQPFVSNNDISKIDLTEEQKKKILGDNNILTIYPDLETILNNDK